MEFVITICPFFFKKRSFTVFTVSSLFMYGHIRTLYVRTRTYIVHTDPYIQYTSMSVNQNHTHSGFGYSRVNLSEPKPNVIRMFRFGTGCEPKPYIQCMYIVRP